jgi:hypothetical protein
MPDTTPDDGLLTEAEEDLAASYEESGLSHDDAVAKVKDERVGPAAELEHPPPEPHVPGGHVAPPFSQPVDFGTPQPTTGGLPAESRTGLTAAEVDALGGQAAAMEATARNPVPLGESPVPEFAGISPEIAGDPEDAEEIEDARREDEGP